MRINKIKVRNIFAAVSDKSILDPLLQVLDKKLVQFWGTEGTVKYLRSKGFSARSVVAEFDFDSRVKSLDRKNFIRILADRTNKKHLAELRKLSVYSSSPSESSGREEHAFVYSSSERSESRSLKVSSSLGFARDKLARTIGVDGWEPFDLVIIDLYPPDKKNFPESMDIGGQAIIRAAVKNYKNMALAFDRDSITELVTHLKSHRGLSLFQFRKQQAQKALRFIAYRSKLEASYGL